MSSLFKVSENYHGYVFFILTRKNEAKLKFSLCMKLQVKVVYLGEKQEKSTYSCLEYKPSSISPSAGAIFEILKKQKMLLSPNMQVLFCPNNIRDISFIPNVGFSLRSCISFFLTTFFLYSNHRCLIKKLS